MALALYYAGVFFSAEISEGGDVIKASEAIRSPKELTDGCQRIEVYTD